MKISRPLTEKYHNWEEGETGKPIKDYYKKGFWKKFDRKKWFKNLFKKLKALRLYFVMCRCG